MNAPLLSVVHVAIAATTIVCAWLFGRFAAPRRVFRDLAPPPKAASMKRYDVIDGRPVERGRASGGMNGHMTATVRHPREAYREGYTGEIVFHDAPGGPLALQLTLEQIQSIRARVEKSS